MLKSKNLYNLKMVKNDNEKYKKVAQEKVVNGFYCEVCHYSCVRKYNFDKHKTTASHISQILSNEKILHDKLKKIYICNICDYTTEYKCNFTKHNLTAAHTKVLGRILESSTSKNICLCGKEYKFMSGLTRHKQVCKENAPTPTQNNTMLEILKDNKEFKELIIEQNKQIIELTKTATNQTNNYNTQNNIQNNTQQNITFNLNYFLNEQCKNAIDMSEFIETLQDNFETLENTGKNGIVKSLTQLITKELSKMGVYERPIHCSDIRRKILHIKDNGIWHKDTEDKTRTKQTLRRINHKVNVLQIPKWLHSNPRSENSEHNLNTIYLKMIQNSMLFEDETYNKIIHNVSERFHINKNITIIPIPSLEN